ncbi:hypothetical protein EW146_g8803 [Bondarzewia mesenterica]|uniref:CCHC-type domain-containing protein n=1 Tax=Bondarzewia mesenterica TaxID=1095465 RepID=A0A4V3XDB4_9AGAM|nr:hypothetical protein EW146_g8803 [Bondarzewia mesenterica]
MQYDKRGFCIIRPKHQYICPTRYNPLGNSQTYRVPSSSIFITGSVFSQINPTSSWLGCLLVTVVTFVITSRPRVETHSRSTSNSTLIYVPPPPSYQTPPETPVHSPERPTLQIVTSPPLSAPNSPIRQLPDPEGDAFLAQGLGGVSLEEEDFFAPHIPHPRNTGMSAETSAAGGGGDDPLDYAKIAKPEPFDGDVNKIKKFLRQCELTFMLKPKEFHEDRVKIIFTLSYMSKGTAADWAGIYIDAMISEKWADGTPYVADHWKQFKEKLEKAFLAVMADIDAKLKMSLIKQGARRVDEYITEFRLLMAHMGYNEAAHLEYFRMGLNRPLMRRKILMTGEGPEDLEDWFVKAVKHDLLYRENEAWEKAHSISEDQVRGSGSGQRKTWDGHVVPRPQQGRLDEPMEVDAMKQRRPIICYKCQKPGHIARDCRSQINFNEMDWNEIRALVLKEEKGKGKAQEFTEGSSKDFQDGSD